MSGPRIIHLTTVHPWNDVRVFLKECRTLAGAGYDVTLIAPRDGDATVDGVKVIGLPRPAGRFARVTSLQWHAFRAVIRHGGRVVHFHDPELIPICVLLKLMGRRVIYDAHEDLQKQTMAKEWLAPAVRLVTAFIVDKVEWGAARLFDTMVAATPSIGARFPKSKTHVVQNFPMMEEMFVTEGTPHGKREPIVCYVGGISVIRGAFEMVRAIGKLPDTLSARLLIAGDISDRALRASLEATPGWGQVQALGYQSRDQVADLLGRARAGLVTLHPAPNHLESQPIKMFEYMAAGLPVIASDFPYWRKIIDGHRCGLLVDPLNPNEIAAAIQWVLEHPDEAEAMGRRGQKAVLQRFNWSIEAGKLCGVYAGSGGESRFRGRSTRSGRASGHKAAG